MGNRLTAEDRPEYFQRVGAQHSLHPALLPLPGRRPGRRPGRPDPHYRPNQDFEYSHSVHRCCTVRHRGSGTLFYNHS